jgi:endoglucanase
MVDVQLLKEICEMPGAPGFEQHIRKVVLREIEPLVDEVRIDPMGNVIALRKGKSGKRVMTAAHMDEISFIVTHIR